MYSHATGKEPFNTFFPKLYNLINQMKSKKKYSENF